MRVIFLIIGCVFMPFFYILFILMGMHFPLVYLYKDFFNHYKSGEPFGIFDGGCK